MKINIPQELRVLTDSIIKADKRPVLVGGAVRDAIIGLEPKDFDVEVFGVDRLEILESILSTQFRVDSVGRSFGVLKVTVDKSTFDVSLPRSETKTGEGHRNFDVKILPEASFKEAAARRDFTMNAIGFDVIEEKILDPFDGVADIGKRIIRHVSDKFDEDPLRVLRACQFAARFGFSIVEETLEKCREINRRAGLQNLAKERFWEEWKKLLLKSRRPSIGMEALFDTGSIALYPEFVSLLVTQQDPEWHPEGDVWIHTKMVVDGAVRVCHDDEIEDETEKLIIMLAALCHDLGKPSTTELREGRWRAFNHEELGVEPTKEFLNKIGTPPSIIEAVTPLVAQHLKPFQFYKERAGNNAIRRLALKVSIERLCKVARADFLGRTTEEALSIKNSRDIEPTKWLLEKASSLGVKKEGPKPFLMGRHLIEKGFKPGKEIGKILAKAFEEQIEGRIQNESDALKWLIEYGNNLIAEEAYRELKQYKE